MRRSVFRAPCLVLLALSMSLPGSVQAQDPSSEENEEALEALQKEVQDALDEIEAMKRDTVSEREYRALRKEQTLQVGRNLHHCMEGHPAAQSGSIYSLWDLEAECADLRTVLGFVRRGPFADLDDDMGKFARTWPLAQCWVYDDFTCKWDFFNYKGDFDEQTAGAVEFFADVQRLLDERCLAEVEHGRVEGVRPEEGHEQVVEYWVADPDVRLTLKRDDLAIFLEIRCGADDVADCSFPDSALGGGS